MKFTYSYLENQLKAVLEAGYEFCTCEEYLEKKKHSISKLIVNRIDVDFRMQKTKYILDIFERLKIKGTFFIRLHAPEYNPFDFESYRILMRAISLGNEIGYHSEVVDESAIWNEDAAECLKRDIEVMNRMFGVKVKGAASHNGMTGLNNLDFWKDRRPTDFGLLYEAYDSSSFGLFENSLYISDSEWTRWKCYRNGVLAEGDRRSPSEQIKDSPRLVYLLTHPDTYYSKHFYE